MTREEKLSLEAFKNVKERQNQPTFLTEAHKENEIAAKKQLDIWQKSSATLEEIIERQRQREI
ncbi:MAG: hypothetical protein ACPG44_09915 [Polaribacter sp.]